MQDDTHRQDGRELLMAVGYAANAGPLSAVPPHVIAILAGAAMLAWLATLVSPTGTGEDHRL
jgi:hypothetical protein